MQKMQKIKKRREFKGLADIGRPAENMQKMQKFTSEATALHALLWGYTPVDAPTAASTGPDHEKTCFITSA
jgi:hypothetical protein